LLYQFGEFEVLFGGLSQPKLHGTHNNVEQRSTIYGTRSTLGTPSHF